MNELDLGVVALPIDRMAPIDVTPVRSDPMMAIFPASAVDLPDDVTAEYLKSKPLLFVLPTTQMHRITKEWFEKQGIHPEPILNLGNSEATKAMVAAGVGVSILAIENEDDPFLGHELQTRPLSPPLTREMGLVVHRNKPFHPGMTVVRDRLLMLQN